VPTESVTAKFANDTAVLPMYSDPAIASQTANQPKCSPKMVKEMESKR
jgi:hypothetical protein